MYVYGFTQLNGREVRLSARGSFDEAKRELIAFVLVCANVAPTEAEAEESTAAAEDMNLESKPFEIECCGRKMWVREIED